MPQDFIALDRAFHKVTEKELSDSAHLAQLADMQFGDGLKWPDLLAHQRVLILAAGGVGKTREMQEQCARLRAEGKPSFFIALESLGDDDLEAVLRREERAEILAWQAADDAPAYFFLDSVDELKLSKGTLERALRRFSKALSSAGLRRAHIYLSCRPKDWSESIDHEAVKRWLATPPDEAETALAEDATFIATLSDQSADPGDREAREKDDERNQALLPVMLLPLDSRRVRKFAAQKGVTNIDAFMDEIVRRSAESLVARPLDLAGVIEKWHKDGALGVRSEQLQANIDRTTREEDGPHADGALPRARITDGIERLALAMTLAKCTMIQARPASAEAPAGSLNAAEVLDEWSAPDLERLLRLPIFDVAAIGQVRFHNREIRDLLAAGRLSKMYRDGSLSWRELRRMLIRMKYGETVLLPSMRPIAAWMARECEDVFRLLRELAPEVLIGDRDPEALSITARADLLRGYVEAYRSGTWRGMGFDLNQLRRLVDPELGPIVRELWETRPENDEVRDLLIDLIWHGPLEDCADIAKEVAFDRTAPDGIRTSAARALLAVGSPEAVDRFVRDELLNVDSWSGFGFAYLLHAVFPRHLSVNDLCTVLTRLMTTRPRRLTSLEWEIDAIVDAVDPRSVTADALRDAWADLILAGADAELDRYRMKSRYHLLADPLAQLCARQIAAGRPADQEIATACVIAARFQGDRYSRRDGVVAMRAEIAKRLDYRRASLTADLRFMQARFEREVGLRAAHSCLKEEGAAVSTLKLEDAPWLEALVRGEDDKEREPAFWMLIWLRNEGERPDERLQELKSLAEGHSELEEIVRIIENPPPRSESEGEERYAAIRERHDQAERERIAEWETWRDEMRSDPMAAFSGTRLDHTVLHLMKWLRMATGTGGHAASWDRALIRTHFSQEFLDTAERALMRFWRRRGPPLPSEIPEERRNTMSYWWLDGLTAVKAEACGYDWAAGLGPEEVDTAVRFAVQQLNGLPAYVDDLIDAHPDTVHALLAAELSAQFEQQVGGGDLPLLRDVHYGGEKLQALLLPDLSELLDCWLEAEWTKETTPALSGLSLLLRTLCDAGDEATLASVASKCRAALAAESDGPFTVQFLTALFRCDFASGAEALTTRLTDETDEAQRSQALSHLAGLFGRRSETLLPDVDDPLRASSLHQLVRFAYRVVRREDDNEHDGVFSPDTRDDAETARGFLLSALFETPGPEARRLLYSLAEDPIFEHLADRIRRVSDERLAQEAEFEPYTASDILRLHQSAELPARTGRELLDVVIGRLEESTHDLQNAPASYRAAWGRLKNEDEAQVFLASELRGRRRGAYNVVVREQQVAGQNRPDITVSTNGSPPIIVALEVKLLEYRSANSLVTDLRHQLVAKYLRHREWPAGCFVLINNRAGQTWQHPETGARFKTFEELLDYLRTVAAEVVAENGHVIDLEIFGLDIATL